MDILLTAVTVTLIIITSLYWGTLLSIRLPETDDRFDRKPFNCRPCLTFHLAWTISALCAVVVCDLRLLIIGVTTAFILFIIVNIIDNQKITK